MNEDSDKLLAELEAATGAIAPQHDAHDQQTQALREGWLALGRVLEAAETVLPEPVESWRAAPPLPARRFRPAVLISLCASISAAVALALVVWALSTEGPNRPTGSEIASARGSTDPPAPHPLPGQTGPGSPASGRQPSEPAPASDVAELRWDDPLDDQIISVTQALVQIERDWASTGGHLDRVRDGLQNLDSEMGQGTL